MLKQSIALLLLLVPSSLLAVSAKAQEANNEAVKKASQELRKATLASTLIQQDIQYKATSKIPEIPSFSLQKGNSFSEMPAGFLLVGGKSYSPLTAGADANVSADTVKNGQLGNLKFLKEMPLSDFLAANPQLKNFKASSIQGWGQAEGKTIGELAADPITGAAPIPAEVLQSTQIGELPGVIDTPYSAYKNIGKVPISQLFAVENIGLDKVLDVNIGNVPAGLQFMKLDRLATKETKIGLHAKDNVSSGSNKKPNNPCTEEKACSYGELRSTVFKGQNPLNGTKAIIDRESPGGEGLLGEAMTAAGFLEKDGYEVPYIGACGAKWSITQPDASKGTVQQQLFLRICYDTPIGRQATPYILGPISIGEASEKANTAFIPMVVKPKINAVATTPTVQPVKEAADQAQKTAFSKTVETEQDIKNKIASSPLSANQQIEVLRESLAILKENPLMGRNAIIAEAARSALAGQAIYSNPTNPALPVGGSPDAATTSILS
jgi:hypothetical protein